MLAKPTSGDTNEPRVTGEEGRVLTRGLNSSVVIDDLCSQATGQNATVACFYFDFASQNEQPPTRFLGSLSKQMVFGLEEIPEEISKAYEDRKCRWWAGTANFGYFEYAADYIHPKARVHMN